ncbi:hypothetical protein DPMN_188308 [Dreissena polymorpha]|uniref:Uncharacterized protein n=1 Tax=Dreissena polymorpha TaxID=45954 RepID=A0A9D4DQN2_DREPO|nr:hypothetical protein DPMN_188308 [Dreissena polymorpha]
MDRAIQYSLRLFSNFPRYSADTPKECPAIRGVCMIGAAEVNDRQIDKLTRRPSALGNAEETPCLTR